ncbi:AAA family ATPase [Cylindrospermopsis raciborskii]|uniref:AAA family ATPase n=1 Tax=Cylindrospermopsis raciborskii TaxID=77022 RepID=UPI001C6429F4|nr:AAA family ATPase [Cylindrospermopsis raciborskii]
MAQIKVQNFGPIKSGLVENDGLVDIRKITVFIGNQGTGKSSIAKLISMFSWLEKQLYRGSLDEKDVISRNRLVNIYCNYNNLKKYFRSGTEIEYRGSAYTMTYADSKLTINRSDNTPRKYVLPKIMYIPAERNFFSVIKKAEKVKGLPLMLLDFFKELERSQQELSETLDLPVGNVKLEFDQTSQNLILRGDNYKLNISEASSGFQSLVPAFLVSRNIALSINQNQGSSQSELSAEEQKRLTTEIQAIINDENLSKEVKKAALELLSSKYRNECFLNIVEELEQNLFPTSQRDILYKLLEFVNITAGNTLL